MPRPYFRVKAAEPKSKNTTPFVETKLQYKKNPYCLSTVGISSLDLVAGVGSRQKTSGLRGVKSAPLSLNLQPSGYEPDELLRLRRSPPRDILGEPLSTDSALQPFFVHHRF